MIGDDKGIAIFGGLVAIALSRVLLGDIARSPTRKQRLHAVDRRQTDRPTRVIPFLGPRHRPVKDGDSIDSRAESRPETPSELKRRPFGRADLRPMAVYDLVCVGCGPAGETAAVTAAHQGFRVLVDRGCRPPRRRDGQYRHDRLKGPPRDRVDLFGISSSTDPRDRMRRRTRERSSGRVSWPGRRSSNSKNTTASRSELDRAGVEGDRAAER